MKNYLVKELLNDDSLYFYDASAPLIDSSTINMDIAYKKSRYDKGDGDYINCPFTKEEYLDFYNALIQGEIVHLKDFEINSYNDLHKLISKDSLINILKEQIKILIDIML